MAFFQASLTAWSAPGADRNMLAKQMLEQAQLPANVNEMDAAEWDIIKIKAAMHNRLVLANWAAAN